MKYLHLALVSAIEKLCDLLDHIPIHEDGRWYAFGGWGCRLGIASWSASLDERWHTGWWAAP